MSRPVLIDANLLLLLLTGLAAPEQLKQHKRLKRYPPFAFEMLVMRLVEAGNILMTPNVLTETSNLLPTGGEALRNTLMATLRGFIDGTKIEGLDLPRTEHHVPSLVAAAHRAFLRLGLTDATPLDSSFAAITLLTDDLPLYVEASSAGRDVEYFTHSLQQAGLL